MPIFTEFPSRRVFSETELPEMAILGNPKGIERKKAGVERSGRKVRLDFV